MQPTVVDLSPLIAEQDGKILEAEKQLAYLKGERAGILRAIERMQRQLAPLVSYSEPIPEPNGAQPP